MRTSLSAKPLQFHAPALKRAEKSLHHIAALDPQGYRSLLAPRRLLELAILVVAQSDDPGASDGAGAGVQRWRWRLVFAAIKVQHHFCCVPSDIRKPTLVRRHTTLLGQTMLTCWKWSTSILPFGFESDGRA